MEDARCYIPVIHIYIGAYTKFSRAKFSRLEVDPRKTRKFGASKIWRYAVVFYPTLFKIWEGEIVQCNSKFLSKSIVTYHNLSRLPHYLSISFDVKMF